MSDVTPIEPGREPLLEIQVHPAEIRWGVRYYFLTRTQVVWGVIGLALTVAFVLLNLVAAPGVVRDRLNRRQYEQLLGERERLGERLQALNAELAELGDQTDRLHHRMSRIYLTYGLASDRSIGQGGFPFPEAEETDSIYGADMRRGLNLEGRIEEQLGVLAVFIDEVQTFETAHADQVRTTPSTCPLKTDDFVLTSPFGTRRSPFTKNLDTHSGIDLAAPAGTEIHAPADGVVVFAGRYPERLSLSWWRFGNLVALRHGESFITLFGHCQDILVRQGQKVKQGDVIALVGNTGWSTSSHLHYEVRKKDDSDEFRPVDPRIYILDHRWRDEERLLVRARRAPDLKDFEPLPRLIGR